jgi:hypothetical protein
MVWGALCVGVLGACLALFAIMLNADVGNPPQAAFARLHRSARQRWEAWSYAVQLLRDEPLHGVGWGNFRLFQPASECNVFFFAHNDYLQIAAEIGLVRASAAGIAFVAVVIWLTCGWKRTIPRELHPVYLGCLGGLSTLVLHSLMDFNARVPLIALTAVLIFGLVVGLRANSTLSSRQLTLASALIALIAAGGWRLLNEFHQRQISLFQIRRAIADLQRPKIMDEHQLMHRLSLTLARTESVLPASKDFEAARSLGDAYLNLSGGRPNDALKKAAKYYQSALEILDQENIRDTVRQIQDQLSGQDHLRLQVK